MPFKCTYIDALLNPLHLEILSVSMPLKRDPPLSTWYFKEGSPFTLTYEKLSLVFQKLKRSPWKKERETERMRVNRSGE